MIYYSVDIFFRLDPSQKPTEWLHRYISPGNIRKELVLVPRRHTYDIGRVRIQYAWPRSLHEFRSLKTSNWGGRGAFLRVPSVTAVI